MSGSLILPDAAVMLARFQARDASYDGRFVTGVTSTRIYCLPSCPARKPLPENVRFFRTESEAVGAGYRPCRRCRPDDYYRGHDPDLEMLTTLLDRFRSDPGRYPDVAALVEASGHSASHIHDLVRRHYHETPARLMRSVRVRLIARALLRSPASMLDVAFAHGFESSSAFHDGFRRVMSMSPAEYREIRRGEFTLRLPTDYQPSFALRMLARDPDSRCERVSSATIEKAIPLRERATILEITIDGQLARCRIAGGQRLQVEDAELLHEAATRMLGLWGDPSHFERRGGRDASIRDLVAPRSGLRIPLTSNVFESLLWAVVGQQVNLRFASSLRRTVVELAGEDAGGMKAHPTAEAVARLDTADLVRRKFSRSKAEYLLGAARTVAAGTLALERLPARDATAAREQLLACRGIGPWSAAYVLMRGCGFADVVPLGDSGLAAALQTFFALDRRPDSNEMAVLMAPFSPHRSLATFHLWNSLGGEG